MIITPRYYSASTFYIIQMEYELSVRFNNANISKCGTFRGILETTNYIKPIRKNSHSTIKFIRVSYQRGSSKVQTEQV